MPNEKPLSDEDVETYLHDLMRQIVNVRPATAVGREALRIALVGPYGALMRMERLKAQDGSEAPPPSPRQ